MQKDKTIEKIDKSIKELNENIAILSGPGFANDVAQNRFVSVTIASLPTMPSALVFSLFLLKYLTATGLVKINNAMDTFNPNCYVEVGKEGVDAKIKALSMYRGVMRPYPHPRSAEYITGLAAMRGGQWGCNYAEAFEIVLRKY